MRKLILAAASGAVVLVGAGLAIAADIPAYVSAAVADAARPDADRMRDPERKPAEVLTFAGVHPGEKIGELIPGGGYYTRLLSHIAGPSGHVYGLWPDGMAKGRPQMLDDLAKIAPNISNVTYETVPSFPEKLDLFWTSENYHDQHNPPRGAPAGTPQPDVRPFDKAVFDALKPGGIYLIEDHAAAADAGPEVTYKMHRINPAQIKSEVESVGFKLVGESDVLKNPADPHTAMVFDPSIRGHTDKLLLKFRKP
ncbi:MAG TPA: methyltransferase [Caulobacteraceae bacterium]|nr:methyltransferase [Caulobacteraceae bacterium]